MGEAKADRSNCYDVEDGFIGKLRIACVCFGFVLITLTYTAATLVS